MSLTNHTPLRWGILGAGSIAKRFSDDVSKLPDHQLAAVGSRDQAKADEFANRYSIPNRHTSYEALVADESVDVIYVATPHNFHKEHSLLALHAGKHVLCEKPFAINSAEAHAIIDGAKASGKFLMEGMWTRCFPIMFKVRELIESGAIGEPRMVQGDFGFRAGVNPESRLFNPALGGGGLMDVGVYTVSFAQMVFGKPNRIASLANIGTTGVDEEAGMLLGFPSGGLAVLSTAIRLSTPHQSSIWGTEGRIDIHSPSWCPRKMTLKTKGEEEVFEMPFEGGGFQFEAMHIAECIRAGKTESPVITHQMTLDIMETLDTLRAQMGVSYPME